MSYPRQKALHAERSVKDISSEGRQRRQNILTQGSLFTYFWNSCFFLLPLNIRLRIHWSK